MQKKEASFKWKKEDCSKGRMVVSQTSTLIPKILHTFHDSILGGHSGFLRTYERISGELYWRGMKAEIKKYVEQC